jgi:hypothetical protein
MSDGLSRVIVMRDGRAPSVPDAIAALFQAPAALFQAPAAIFGAPAVSLGSVAARRWRPMGHGAGAPFEEAAAGRRASGAAFDAMGRSCLRTISLRRRVGRENLAGPPVSPASTWPARLPAKPHIADGHVERL